jgi:hypothetical protein
MWHLMATAGTVRQSCQGCPVVNGAMVSMAGRATLVLGGRSIARPTVGRDLSKTGR